MTILVLSRSEELSAMWSSKRKKKIGGKAVTKHQACIVLETCLWNTLP